MRGGGGVGVGRRMERFGRLVAMSPEEMLAVSGGGEGDGIGCG